MPSTGDSDTPGYFAYWGKASTTDPAAYHPLPCHCLDVAAVAHAWLDADPALMGAFERACRQDAVTVKAWTLFFVTLHDLGKCDVRFQLKVPQLAYRLKPEVKDAADVRQARGFSHTEAGLGWFVTEFTDYGLEHIDRDALLPWARAVFAHHGQVPQGEHPGTVLADASIVQSDILARREWALAVRRLFLEPAGVGVKSSLPPCPNLLAGFCSVCDWLGSNNANGFFPFRGIDPREDVSDYYHERLDLARKALPVSGMVAHAPGAGGMAALFPDLDPRGFQTVVDSWPLAPGLTIVEAPTGSGKTEVALSYASRLIADGLADGIVFALPTQATANAMLARLHRVADRLFPSGTNLVLAHGKARFHPLFDAIKAVARQRHETEREDGIVQCASWLAESRKRVFLGQIGVCTVDQVLLSALPVRHYFVRGFGLRRNVLIVDEVHAYDRYMNTLLDRVLDAQRAGGGSAILLSATLPAARRRELLDAWTGSATSIETGNPYPLVSFANLEKANASPAATTDTPAREVAVRVVESQDMLPPPDLIEEIRSRAAAGAIVVVVCNLVDVAQRTWRALGGDIGVPVDLFHARFRFTDRQAIEQRILDTCGRSRSSDGGGRILVATQVVEQSLDLDFDWMVTQLCPVDLLFQRLGRLHRHDRPRPACANHPECAVLVPIRPEYEKHLAIYRDPLVLWRTERLLRPQLPIHFPSAYREWLELVYAPASDDVPPDILDGHQAFEDELLCSRQKGLQIAVRDPSDQQAAFDLWPDTDDRAARLTRDGEMSLTVVPLIEKGGAQRFLDDEDPLASMDEWTLAERLNRESIPVPCSWKKALPQSEEGIYYLPMLQTADGTWCGEHGGMNYVYGKEFGLLRERIVNLLRDPWVPVRDAAGFRHVRLEDVLCNDCDWTISLPRDDMEMAALQLAICLTQTILTPESAGDLRAREAKPLEREKYRQAAEKWAATFDLCHSEHPFMQTRGAKAKENTAVQRLFVGLPDKTAGSGNAQAFFNETDEISCACPSCAAIGLFQHCTNGVNFGGGFMSGLKGMVPVTTLVRMSALRPAIWRNVLSREYIRSAWTTLAMDGEGEKPTWELPIRQRVPGRKPTVETAAEIGMVRGLFWQSAKLELVFDKKSRQCGLCGVDCEAPCIGFKKEQFPFEYQGFWQHPHTPFRIGESVSEGNHNLRVDSRGRFWTDMAGYFWDVPCEGEHPGYRPALVVGGWLTVLVG